MRNGRKNNVTMIVDDDLFVRKILSTALDGLTEIIEVTDGASVVETYKQHMPDVVLLDFHLPNKSGLDLLKEIVIHDRDAYVIMISADSIEENIIKSTSLGAMDFLTKPFDKQRVLDLFNKCPTIKFAD